MTSHRINSTLRKNFFSSCICVSFLLICSIHLYLWKILGQYSLGVTSTSSLVDLTSCSNDVILDVICCGNGVIIQIWCVCQSLVSADRSLQPLPGWHRAQRSFQIWKYTIQYVCYTNCLCCNAGFIDITSPRLQMVSGLNKGLSFLWNKIQSKWLPTFSA